MLADIAAAGGAEDAEDDTAGAEAPQEKARRSARKPLPDSLLRRDVGHLPAGGCSCRACGGALRKVGEDVTGILECRPGRFEVVRHVRPAFSCRTCEAITQAAMPALPIERGRPGPGPVSGRAGRDLLEPMAASIGRHALAGPRLHADDTPMAMLAPGKGRTRTARVWADLRDDRPFGGTDLPAVLYGSRPDRKGEPPQRRLRDFQGLLQADA